MRRGCTPCWIHADARFTELERVRFDDKDIAEDFLQRILHSNPALIPVAEIDASFGPLVSLGREIAGIDNLFISPEGRITLVETKLWRNPQAVREVVAQALDYVTRLKTWTYEDLQTQALAAVQGSPSLYRYVAERFPDAAVPEPDFVDTVTTSLRTGRVLVVIVGDGIRESLATMLDGLQRHPSLLFSFAMVELAIYTNPEVTGGRLVVPQVVARTEEVVRAVVRVQTDGPAAVTVEMEQEPDKTEPGYRRRTLSEQEFFEVITDVEVRSQFKDLLAFGLDLGAEPVWRTSSVSIRLPDPTGGRRQPTLFVMTTGGQVYFWWLAGQLEAAGLPQDIAHNLVARMSKIFGVPVNAKTREALARYLTSAEVRDHYDEFRSAISETVEQIKAATEKLGT